MSFEIRLPLFEGPFDLLLFFIERDELDIHDIPISRITDEFLDYIQQLEALNLDLASEFILVAASLMRIKAKMLIPRPSLTPEGEEIDPREELVRHLLEYKKYKSVLAELATLEEDRLLKEGRGNILAELKKIGENDNVEAELQDLDLYKLLKVYTKVLARFELASKKPVHTVVQYPYTIAQQKDYILALVADGDRIAFDKIITADRHRAAVVHNFLAILELLQSGHLRLHLGLGFNNFWIEAETGQEAAPVVLAES